MSRKGVSRTVGFAVGFAVAFAFVTVSCKKGSKQQASASASSQAAKLPANVDAKLLNELNELVKVCKVDLKDGTLNCAQGEQRRLVSEFVSSQRDRAKTPATFAVALANPKPELRAVAANVLYSAFRSPWGPNAKPGAVPGADADALLAATLKLPKAQALQAIPAAVHAEMLANRGDALNAALDKTNEAQLRITAIRYLMTHGRLQAFPKVQELAKSPDLQVALAAFESPHNMYNWTQAEQAAICPWAAQFVADPRPQIGAKSAMLLASCSGEHVDRLLELGEANLKAEDFPTARVGAYRDLCARSRLSQPNAPTEEQCKRARKLLENVVRSSKLPEQTRTMALAALAYQWPDADTLKLATKLKSDSNKSLAENASRTVARLEQRQHQAARAADERGTAKPMPGAPATKIKPASGPATPRPAPAAPAPPAAPVNPSDNPF